MVHIIGIKSIKAIGVSLYRVTFDSVENANNAVRNNDLAKKKIKPFIPRTYLETFGVIRDVPTFLSDEDIILNLQWLLPRFDILEDYDQNFPQLTQQSSIGFRNKDVEVNKILTPRPYNNVVMKPVKNTRRAVI
ncbi:hypothetical protein CVS40_10946 [Lucilia cuprina]|nr:hypothetical protein CVS40_10946 [Lucilia cuprina]